MGITKQSSLAAGVGGSLAVAAAIAFATWPAGPADGDGPGRPPAADPGTTVLELASSDDGSDDRDDREDGDDDREDDGGEERVARTPDGIEFELEIDPELDARFGPRPVNGVQAAEIAMAEFGGRVVAVELDEEDGRPVWEVELAGAEVDEVDVDAIDGRVR